MPFQMESAHDKMVRAAERLKLKSETRGKIKAMRKKVFFQIERALSEGKGNKSKYKLSRKEIKLTGSLYRETAMEDLSDVDVVLALNIELSPNSSGYPKPVEILNFIYRHIPKGYSTEKKNRSIKVTKNTPGSRGKKISMDIVPALINKSKKSSSWWLGISDDGHQWIKFNPEHQKKIFEKLKLRKNQRDDPTALIICLKEWRNTCFTRESKKGINRKKLPSFVLEALVWEDYKRNSKDEKDLTVRFNRILKGMNRIRNPGIKFDKLMTNSHKPKGKKAATDFPLIQDPSNLSVNLVRGMNDDIFWWIKEAERASKKTTSFEKIFRR